MGNTFTYRVFIHPDGKMWALGTSSTMWVTLWGVIQKEGSSGYYFSHASNPKRFTAAAVNAKVNEKRRKGYVEERGHFEEERARVTTSGAVLVPKGTATSPATSPPDPVPWTPPEGSVPAEDAKPKASPTLVVVDAETLDARGIVAIGI